MDQPSEKYIISKDGFSDILIICKKELIRDDIFYKIQAGSDKQICANILIFPSGNKWIINIKDLPEYEMKTTLTKTGGFRKKKYRQKIRKYKPGFNTTEFDLTYKDGFPY
jgi:hypothetical protein